MNGFGDQERVPEFNGCVVRTGKLRAGLRDPARSHPREVRGVPYQDEVQPKASKPLLLVYVTVGRYAPMFSGKTGLFWIE